MPSDAYWALESVSHHLPMGTVPVAVIGNILTFAVFSMKCYGGNLTSMLYRVLAVAQILYVVVSDGLYYFPLLIGNIDIITYNHATCKAIIFLQLQLRAFVAWVLCMISLERVIGIIIPHRSKSLNTKRHYAWLLLGMITFLSALYGPLLYTVEREEVDHDIEPMVWEDAFCVWGRFDGKLMWYSDVLFNWMNLVMASLLPFVIIITFNVAISCAIIKSTWLMRQSTNTSNSQQATFNGQIGILFSICITFVIMSLPFPLKDILDHYYVEQATTVGSGPIHLDILVHLGHIGDTLTSTLTIVFYCGFGKKFRQCLKRLLCCKC